jgi:hypothetical protein
MASLSGFDANKVEPQTEYPPPIPAGDYDVVIIGSEMKATKDGNGQYLRLEFAVLNGPHQNRKLSTNLNLVNKNAKAVEIAKGSLSAICRAVGVLTPNDSSDLHGKPLTIKVTIRKSEEHGDQNDIKAFKVRGSSPAAPAAPTSEPAPWAA